MLMIKANDFFFLSGIHDHIVCDIQQAGGMTHLRFADEEDQTFVVSIIVKRKGYDFNLDGTYLESVTVSRSAVLNIICEHVNGVFGRG